MKFAILIFMYFIGLTTKITYGQTNQYQIEKKMALATFIDSYRGNRVPFPIYCPHDTILHLPFGIKLMDNDTSNYYTNLIGTNLHNEDSIKKQPSFLFPEVTRINYVKIDSTEYSYCQNGILIDSIFTALPYQYRLPNVANYECYYSTGVDYQRKDYSEKMREQCRGFTYWYYGYLILYDRKIKLANILPVFYIQGQDGYIQARKFYIDEKFIIYLCDFAFMGEDDDKVEKTVSCNYYITISTNGIIQSHHISNNESIKRRNLDQPK